MAQVVDLAAYRKERELEQMGREILSAALNGSNEFDFWPFVPKYDDTAPCEYVAPESDPA